MRRLDRYIFREVLVPGLIALVALTFVVFSSKAGVLLDILIRHSPAPSEIGGVVAALLPAVLTVTLPMALLMGILTAFSRMSSDSEIVAMRSAGIRMRRILRPVLILAILCCALTLTLTVWTAPRAAANLRSIQTGLALRYPVIELRPRIFDERPGWPWKLFVNDS